MYHVTRAQSQPHAAHYPLPITAEAHFEQTQTAQWRMDLELPDIPTEHIIVPSFAARGNAAHGYQFTLTGDNLPAVPLHPVPGFARPAAPAAAHRALTAHIDCWHSHAPVRAPRVSLLVDSSHAPGDWLVSISIRPLLDYIDPPTNQYVRAQTPMPISQMQGPRSIKQRICSPTALAMIMPLYAPYPPWPLTVRGCFDPITRAYGSWPQAIHWAAAHGILGAVEVLWEWETVARILAAGVPVVTSVNFAANQLSGAPMASTSGHLMVLYGVLGSQVLVADPAAATHDTVLRRYDLEQFNHAWLHHRGAAYIFALNDMPG